jgi:predicted nuclease of predicted toxin-antitoxin system
MKLLLDVNLSPLLAIEMTSAGFETVHWSTVGAFNATDPELMAYAARHGYVVGHPAQPGTSFTFDALIKA